MHAVRRAAVAGMFYPDRPSTLSKTVAGLLEAASPRSNGNSAGAGKSGEEGAQAPKAVIVPHAGYIYSGSTAALAYARVAANRETIRRVVLLGPVHRVPIRGLALPEARVFQTPLGDVEIDPAPELAGLAQVQVSAAAHAQEHSLEVQLPFLQAVLERFTLLPLAVGDASPEEVADVIDAVWGGAETLVVISSDLSHYHPYREAQQLDRDTVRQILELDATLTHRQACGATPVNGMVFEAARRRLRPTLLGLCNSGDTAGDRGRVVGYTSVGFAETAS